MEHCREPALRGHRSSLEYPQLSSKQGCRWWWGGEGGALGTVACVGKIPSLPPVFLLDFYIATLTTLLTPDVWRFSPTTSNTRWMSYNLTQF